MCAAHIIGCCIVCIKTGFPKWYVPSTMTWTGSGTGCYRRFINCCEQSEQRNELKYSHGSGTTLRAAVADTQQEDRELLCHVHLQIPFVTSFHNGHLDARSSRLV